jgi:hypothetical protein
MACKTVSIKHRNLGLIKIKVDSEDATLFSRNEFCCYVKNDFTSLSDVPRIIFRNKNDFSQEYASRVILRKHKKLQENKFVFFRDGDSFNLQKKNLFQK